MEPRRSDVFDAAVREQIAIEQATLDELHQRLEQLRRRTGERLAATYRQPVTGTHQSRIERDAFAARDLARLARLSGVDGSLYFGALELDDGELFRIGRVALADEHHNAVLLDWRAPAARPFYTATFARPEGVRRRRHVRSRQQRVLSVDDDILAGDLPADHQAVVSGESALMATLREHRTGRMSDIVATIQTEQDRIIRAADAGVLVVQGAPGTGKTVAALHRAAYLLYTHRERLAERGVLVIGPNATFLSYISQVLPSLGETGVVLSTIPGLRRGYSDAPAAPAMATELKGDARMATIIDRAVKALAVIPNEDEVVVVDGRRLVITPELAKRARTRGRRTRRPHNEARATAVREVLDDLAEQWAGQDSGWFDPDDLAQLRSELAAEEPVRAALHGLWPRCDAETLVHDILSSPRWAPSLRRLFGTDGARAVHRPDHLDPHQVETWTAPDVALLDEAAARLGDVTAGTGADAATRAAQQQRAEEVEFATDLLEGLELTMPVDPAVVAERYAGPEQHRTTSQRAQTDQTWTFGHVIADEAQDLSPMSWRMLSRRCPALSMTVVGDIAQTTNTAGTASWEDVLEPVAPGRWRVEELSVNYRTPAAVMSAAEPVLRTLRPQATSPTSVRTEEEPPWTQRVEPDDLDTAVHEAVIRLRSAVGPGRAAVIAPSALLSWLTDLLVGSVEGVGAGYGQEVLDHPVAVLDVPSCKGLEFDSVLVVEPAQIITAGSQGLHELYVALTRTTGGLGVLYTGDLPEVLATLAP